MKVFHALILILFSYSTQYVQSTEPAHNNKIPAITPRLNKPEMIPNIDILPPESDTTRNKPIPLPEAVSLMNTMSSFSRLGKSFPNNPPVRRGSSSRNGGELIPQGKWLSTMIVKDNTLYIYGGIGDGTSFLNDLWLYNYNEDTWVELETPKRLDSVLTDQINAAQGENVPYLLPKDVPPPPPMVLAPGEIARKIPAAMQQEDGSWSRTTGVDMPIYELNASPALSPIMPVSSPIQPKEAFIQVSEVSNIPPLLDTSGSTSSSTSGDGSTGIPFNQPQDFIKYSSSNTLYVYDLSSLTWMNPIKGVESDDKTTKQQPVSRWMHTAVLVEGTKMVVFGGCKEDLLLTDEVWTFDIDQQQWSLRTKDEDPTKSPGSREGHSAVTITGNGMLIFGGMAQNYIPYKDTWVMSTSGTWKLLPVQDNGPMARWMHTSSGTEDGEMAYMFGGATIDGTALNDLWIFDSKKEKWNEVTVFKGVPPQSRWLAASSAFETEAGPVLVVHGGTDGARLFDDTWLFNAKEATWMELYSVGNTPYARMGHVLVTMRSPPPDATANDSGGNKNSGSFLRTSSSLLSRRLLSTATRSDVPEWVNPTSRISKNSFKYPETDKRNQQRLFMFGGSGEVGLTLSAQGVEP